jgi:hypothetical protein
MCTYIRRDYTIHGRAKRFEFGIDKNRRQKNFQQTRKSKKKKISTPKTYIIGIVTMRLRQKIRKK